MQPANPFELLNRTHILCGTPEELVEMLAASLVREVYEPGEIIFRQGSRPNALYFIEDGSVEILQQHPQKGTIIQAVLEPGDMCGEIEMVFPQARFTTARAKLQTSVYRWDRPLLAAFMKKNPDAFSRLKFAAQSRRLALKRHFDWLAEDEVIYGLARKHSVLLYQALTLPLILLGVAGLLLAWGLFASQSTIAWLGTGFAIPSLALGVWRWIDWGNDYYIVTNRRAVWLEKVIGLYDSRVEAPLHMVLSVSVSTEMVGRMLDYGDVIIRTYTGKLVFQNVEWPHALAAMLEEHMSRMRARQQQTDRDVLREAVLKRLDPEAPLEPPAVSETIDSEPVAPSPPRRGLWRFGFKVRFEEQDVITYRKHWAVLLREILAPSSLIILIVAINGAHLIGWMRTLPWGTLLLLSSIAGIASALWWLYRYVDWANDIYQITPDQIVDIYKKPLAREERKIAPLENILSSEVDRKGLIGILLNYGDVIANVGTELFTFEGVLDPIGVQQDIVHAQEAMLQRKQETERKLRQAEMVELIDIYHDEVVNRKRSEHEGDDSNNGHT